MAFESPTSQVVGLKGLLGEVLLVKSIRCEPTSLKTDQGQLERDGRNTVSGPGYLRT